MAACLPGASNGVSKEYYHQFLDDFEVFGNVPHDKWLDLQMLGKSSEQEVSVGAKLLLDLQKDIPELLSTQEDIGDAMKCYFLQCQKIEAGVQIMPHIDADDPKVDIISTLCVDGDENLLRVGSEEFRIKEGDVYILTGFARHHVKHEVLSSSRERTTVTLRFVSTDPSYREKNGYGSTMNNIDRLRVSQSLKPDHH
jgi:hypothetical protein